MSQTEQISAERVKDEVPGGAADKPTEIPKRGWLQIVKRGWAEAKADQVPLLGAGVAFYGFLALFPALIALVLIYGLVADPAQIASQIGQLTAGLPDEASKIITDQLQLVSSQQTKAGIGTVVAIALALWAASGGMSNLMTAISTAYDEEEKRSFIKKRGLALALTLGAIVFLIVILCLVAVFPALADLIDNGVVRVLLAIVRWVLVAVLVFGRPRRAVPGCARSGCPEDALGVGRSGGGHGALVGCLGGFLALRGQLQQLRQDLRCHRRDRGDAAVAVDHLLRHPARC